MPITITKTGANIATGATSANVAIPTALSGQLPRYVRIAATVAAAVKVGTSGVAAAAGDALVQPGDSLILAIPSGVTHIAAIQIAAAGVVNVVPMEDQ